MQLNNIHSDNRGSIDALVGTELTTCPEVTVFRTKQGYARGGCIHPESWEHLVVVEGTIIYIYKVGDSIFSKNLKAGESFSIAPNVPHYFTSITDSIVMEWGPKITEKQGKHEEFRKIVMGINSRCTTNPSM